MDFDRVEMRQRAVCLFTHAWPVGRYLMFPNWKRAEVKPTWPERPIDFLDHLARLEDVFKHIKGHNKVKGLVSKRLLIERLILKAVDHLAKSLVGIIVRSGIVPALVAHL